MAVVRVLQEIQISPSPSIPSQPPQALSYLDAIMLKNSTRPVERVFFYNFPHPTSHFIDHNLPILTESLSLILRHFYPLAGSIRRSYDFEDQFDIAYEEGDFITITVAEFTGDDDFHNISGYHPKNTKTLCLLVPKTLNSPSSGQFPPVSIQITIFPNQGVCIGFTTNHTVCDGFGMNIFIQSWAASCRSSKPTLNDISPAFFDRSVIIDSHGFGKKIYRAMSQSNKILPEQVNLPVSHPSLVYATFTLRKNHILKLKELVRTKQVEEGKPSYHLSAFVVTCAYVWRCLVKARGCDGENNQYFGIAVDWRSRMRPSIPSNYFGNCLGAFLTELKATELVGNDGFEVAAMEIGKNIDGLEGREFRELVEVVLNKFPKLVEGRQTLFVSGSPKLRYYDVDFGWGRPVKVDSISIIKNGAISLAESREEDGGIEIGLVLSEEEMNTFEMNFATSFLDL